MARKKLILFGLFNNKNSDFIQLRFNGFYTQHLQLLQTLFVVVKAHISHFFYIHVSLIHEQKETLHPPYYRTRVLGEI